MRKEAVETDIVLIDIIDFSRLKMHEQLEIISYLSQTYRKMIRKMLEASGLEMDKMLQGIIPTGDGFYCILHPSLKGFGPILGLSFIHFSEIISKDYPYFKGTRVAVHTGKIHMFEDILGNENFVGDGLNECARYIEIKDLIISTVVISDAAFITLQDFLTDYPDFAALLSECEFKHGSLHTFYDKHHIKRNAYLIWMRKGGIIPPPNPVFARPHQRRKSAL